MRSIRATSQEFEAQTFPHLGNLYRTALLVVDEESEAQRLVQESVISAYRYWHRNCPSDVPRNQLFQIMMNDFVNKHQTFPTSSDVESARSDAAADDVSIPPDALPVVVDDKSARIPFSEVSADDVRSVIRGLPADHRLIVVLALLEGFSHQEIANIIGIRLETVKSNLRRGRGLIKELVLSRRCAARVLSAASGVRSRLTG